jgi:predicted DsbA family dithiol-disulfide isomerase
MTIDVYADIACPWCYVGRAHLKNALAQRSDRGDSSSREEVVSGLRPDLDVTLRWRPFQLQPDMPAEGRDFRTVLERKFGSWDRAERMFERIQQMGREDGLTFNFDAIEVAPNTADAHRLILWAQEASGTEDGDALATALFRAYFTDGQNVSDPDVLVDCAGEVGLDVDAARAMLDGDAYADDVRESQQRAQRRGITGVPCYVFNDRQALTGAQPTDAFLDAFDAVQGEPDHSR